MTKQSTLDNRIPICTRTDYESITFSMMAFLTYCALPFLVVESSAFLAMIKALNPAYYKMMPKADAFTTTWLPKLYDSVKNKVEDFWKTNRNRFRMVGIDDCTDEMSTKVMILTDAIREKVTFARAVALGENGADAKHICGLLRDYVREQAEAVQKAVEDVFACIVFDTTSTNIAAALLLQKKFPKVFAIGCCTHHCLDRLCEDWFKMDELKLLMEDVIELVKCVRHHATVKAADIRCCDT